MPRQSTPAARLIGLALAGSVTTLVAEPSNTTSKLMGLAAFNLDQGPVGRTSSVETRMAELRAKGVSAYLNKPFTPECLRDVITQVLGAAPAPSAANQK